jgi:urea transport system permease protein
MRTREHWILLAAAAVVVVVLPALNALPKGSPLHVSDFTLNLFGKFLTYAILALGIDLIWGYAGVLSLGHGVFFGLGAYAMGMHLMLEIGTQGVYRNVLPDFMVWNRVTELPLFRKPFYSAAFTLLAVVVVPGLVAGVFGFLTFRSRIRGVYFSIITQALALCAWLTFNRNAMNLGGTNGLSGFKTIFGFPLNEAATQRGLYVASAIALCLAFLLCRGIVRSPAGKVLVAIRDSETRVLFCGYSPAAFKLFVFVVSAVLAGVAGALYVGQVGIITPARIGVLPSIEMIIWVAVGGRGTLLGPVVGAVGVNWLQSLLTTHYPDLWILVLGGMFVAVVLFFPEGVVGTAQRLFQGFRKVGGDLKFDQAGGERPPLLPQTPPPPRGPRP